MTSTIFLSLEDEARIFLYLNIIFVCSMALHCISLYLLIKRTPPNQMIVRNFLIVIQVLLIIHDIHLDVLIHPIIVLQALGGYGTGLLLQAGMPLSTTFRTIISMHVIMSIILPIPAVLWMVTTHGKEKSERIMIADPRGISWIQERGFYFFEERRPFVLFAISCCAAILIGCTSICLVVFLHMFYTLRIDSNKRSLRSIQLITRSLLNLFAQLVIPLMLFVVPTTLCAFAIIFEDLLTFESNLIVYVVIPTHSVGHNIILLLVNSAYRELFISLFRKKLKRVSVIPSIHISSAA